MIRGLAGLGFDTICATPHQKAGWFLPTHEDIRAAHAVATDLARDAGIQVQIPLAAENMWDEVFHQRVQEDRVPSYDGGPAFLMELRPTHMPPAVAEHAYRLRVQGKLPVLAHPERYQALWTDQALLEQLRIQCALVVDLGALAGHHGRHQAKAARRMLEAGMVHAVASDVHTPEDVDAAAEGMAWIRKKLGRSALDRLLEHNPRRILAGEHPDA